MNEWTVFATIFGKVQPPVLLWADQTIVSIATQIRLPLLGCLVLFIAGHSLIRSYAPDASPVLEIERKIIRCAIAFTVAVNASVYHQVVADLVTVSLPNWLSSVLTSSFGSASVTIGAAAFDSVWNQAYMAGGNVDAHLSRWGDIGLHILVAAYWVISGGVIAVAFAAWLFAFIAIILLVGVGPIFVAFMAFPATHAMFSRWVGSLLGAVLLQAFIVALLVLMTGAENAIIGQIAAAGQDGSELAGQVVHTGQLLLGGLLLFVACGYMLYELRGLSAGIVGGGAFDLRPVMAATGSAINAALRPADAAVKAGATSAVSAGARAVTAAGRSLSSARP